MKFRGLLTRHQLNGHSILHTTVVLANSIRRQKTIVLTVGHVVHHPRQKNQQHATTPTTKNPRLESAKNKPHKTTQKTPPPRGWAQVPPAQPRLETDRRPSLTPGTLWSPHHLDLDRIVCVCVLFFRFLITRHRGRPTRRLRQCYWGDSISCAFGQRDVAAFYVDTPPLAPCNPCNIDSARGADALPTTNVHTPGCEYVCTGDGKNELIFFFGAVIPHYGAARGGNGVNWVVGAWGETAGGAGLFVANVFNMTWAKAQKQNKTSTPNPEVLTSILK